MFPRNHGKTQHYKIIAGTIVKKGLDEVIRMLVKFGNAAILSDTQIAIAASELTELEFELLGLRQENMELKVRLQVKDTAKEKRRRTQLAPDVLARCQKCNALIETTVHCDNCGTFEPTRR